jgi:hypothetical protein
MHIGAKCPSFVNESALAPLHDSSLDTDWTVMDFAEPVACSRCRRNDQLRKVSTVVREGTASARYVTSQTDLARQLRMPSRPHPTTEPGTESAIGCGVTAVVIMIIWIIAAIIHQEGPGLLAFFILAFLGWIGWVIFVVNRDAAEKARVAKIAQSYPKMERTWNELYYCFRDDVVFAASKQARCVPASRMIELLVDSVN